MRLPTRILLVRAHLRRALDRLPRDRLLLIRAATTKPLNPKPEPLNPKPETQHPKPETRNPKPETRNPKP